MSTRTIIDPVYNQPILIPALNLADPKDYLIDRLLSVIHFQESHSHRQSQHVIRLQRANVSLKDQLTYATLHPVEVQKPEVTLPNIRDISHAQEREEAEAKVANLQEQVSFYQASLNLALHLVEGNFELFTKEKREFALLTEFCEATARNTATLLHDNRCAFNAMSLENSSLGYRVSKLQDALVLEKSAHKATIQEAEFKSQMLAAEMTKTTEGAQVALEIALNEVSEISAELTAAKEDNLLYSSLLMLGLKFAEIYAEAAKNSKSEFYHENCKSWENLEKTEISVINQF
jgi:hypothetical protein